MKHKRITQHQQLAWDALQGNPEVWAKKLPVKEIGRVTGDIMSLITNNKLLNKKADLCLGILMARRLPPKDVCLIVRDWLTTYKLALIPSQMSNFDKFHAKYSKWVFENIRKYND